MEPGEGALIGRLLVGLTPALLGGLLIAGGRMITARRGGVETGAGRFVLFGDSGRDRLDVPHRDVDRIVALPLEERWGDHIHAVWVCYALLKSGARVLLGESTDEQGVKHIAHQIAGAAGLGTPDYELPTPLPAEAPAAPSPPGVLEATDRRLRIRVGAGGNLAVTLLVCGLTMLLIGGFMMVDIANNNVLGFLIGPVLVFLGLILGAIPVIKRGLHETIDLSNLGLTHAYHAYGLTFARRTLKLGADTYVRIRQRGLLGANLELVSDGRIHHLAGGVHSGTLLSPPGLVWLAGRLSVNLRSCD